MARFEICSDGGLYFSEVSASFVVPSFRSDAFVSRFISPAVVAPQTVDIEVPKGDQASTIQRGLMIIAKIIQNLANNIFFGKEAYMTTLNKFLEVNIANVTRFLSELHVRDLALSVFPSSHHIVEIFSCHRRTKRCLDGHNV